MAYTIDPKRLDLAREFMAKPYGLHSDELQRVLNVMRAPMQRSGRLVALCLRRHREWALGRMHQDPLAPIARVDDRVFRSFEEIEKEIFRLRWHELTGRVLDA